jgi:hypothetical protein
VETAVSELSVLHPQAQRLWAVLTVDDLSTPGPWQEKLSQVLDTNLHHQLRPYQILASFAHEEVSVQLWIVGRVDDPGLAEAIQKLLQIWQTNPLVTTTQCAVVATSAATDGTVAQNHAATFLQRLSELNGSLPAAASPAQGILLQRLRSDGAVVSEQELQRLLTMLLLFGIALRCQAQIPVIGNEGPFSIGLAAARVPLAAIMRCIRARLAANLLEGAILRGRGIGSPELLKSRAQQAQAVGLIDQARCFVDLFADVPADAKMTEEGFQLEIRPEYVQPGYLLPSRRELRKWPELLEEFAAMLGQVKIRRWRRQVREKGDDWRKQWEEALERDVRDILTQPSQPLETLQALATAIENQADVFEGPEASGASWDDINRACERLRDTIEAYPNLYAVASRLLFACLPIAYGLWFFGSRLSGDLKVAAWSLSGISVLAAVGAFFFKLAAHERAVRNAAERVIQKISSHFAARLKDQAAAVMESLKNHFLTTAKTVREAAQRLRAETHAAVNELRNQADQFEPPDSSVEQWVVQRDGLPDIYTEQGFDENQLGEMLLAEGVLADEWRNPRASALVERSLFFSQKCTESLSLARFEHYCGSAFLNGLVDWLSEAYQRALPQVPSMLLQEGDTVYLLMPPELPIDQARLDSRVRVDGRTEVDAYALCILRMRPVKQPPSSSDSEV